MFLKRRCKMNSKNKRSAKHGTKKKQEIAEPIKNYICKWCGEEKPESEFYRCAINHKAFICKKCINHKYDEICAKREKVLAVIICCHYLDIAFYKYIYDSLEKEQNLGFYIRQLNLSQNDPDDFEKGLLHNNIVGYREADKRIDKAKKNLDKIIEDIIEVRNDI